MASYRDKKNQIKLETESGKIAWCIEWIETHWEWKKAFLLNGLTQLFDGTVTHTYHICDEDDPTKTIKEVCEYSYSLCTSADSRAYVVYRYNYFDEWMKIVPTECDWKVYKNVLDAQPWQYL